MAMLNNQRVYALNWLVLHHAQRTFTAPVNVHASMWLEVSLADGRMRVMSVGSASSID